MKKILDLIYELRCNINYCKIRGENETEIKNAKETLIKLQELLNDDSTKDMLDEIISWEKDLSEYNSLETILRSKYKIIKISTNE